MINIVPPISEKPQRLVWYLSMEEVLAQAIPDEGMFFVWRTRPTVIFGRNQNMEVEVNIDYCREKGIEMYRRKSGGGCVYSDGGNLMLSCLTPERDVHKAFAEYLDRLAAFLGNMGLPAVKTEHNDIMVDGFKVSGNACFGLPTGSIVHGTLLVDVNMDELAKAITPTTAKLSSHGIKSVRQRVVNLAKLDAFRLDMDELSERLVDFFCDSRRPLTPDELARIEDKEKEYLDPDFIAGKKFED